CASLNVEPDLFPLHRLSSNPVHQLPSYRRIVDRRKCVLARLTASESFSNPPCLFDPQHNPHSSSAQPCVVSTLAGSPLLPSSTSPPPSPSPPPSCNRELTSPMCLSLGAPSLL